MEMILHEQRSEMLKKLSVCTVQKQIDRVFTQDGLCVVRFLKDVANNVYYVVSSKVKSNVSKALQEGLDYYPHKVLKVTNTESNMLYLLIRKSAYVVETSGTTFWRTDKF